MFAKLAEFYAAGGIWMHPIAAVSVVVWAIAIERIYALYFRYNVNAEHLMAHVQKLVLANDLDRAIKLCNAAPSAALPNVVKAALTRANRAPEEISAALEEASVEALRGLTKRVHLLPNLANAATLLGLLGTIVGLIQAFTAVASAPPDMKSQLLTASLAIGLNATAFGLSVAIPALFLFMFLNGASKKIIEDIDQYSLKIENLLVARGRPSPAVPERTGTKG